MTAVFTPRGKGRLPVIGGNDVRLAHQLPGKPADGHAHHCPFDKEARKITGWGLEQVCRAVGRVSRVWVRPALVEQGCTKSKRKSHLGGPDCTLMYTN